MSEELEVKHPYVYMWVGMFFWWLFFVTVIAAISFHMTTAIVFVVLMVLVHLLLKGRCLDRFVGWVADL